MYDVICEQWIPAVACVALPVRSSVGAVRQSSGCLVGYSEDSGHLSFNKLSPTPKNTEQDYRLFRYGAIHIDEP